MGANTSIDPRVDGALNNMKGWEVGVAYIPLNGAFSVFLTRASKFVSTLKGAAVVSGKKVAAKTAAKLGDDLATASRGVS